MSISGPANPSLKGWSFDPRKNEELICKASRPGSSGVSPFPKGNINWAVRVGSRSLALARRDSAQNITPLSDGIKTSRLDVLRKRCVGPEHS